MKKQMIKKTISSLILFVFIIPILLNPINVGAVDSTISEIYSNPNQGSNAYKFKVSDVVNSDLLTSVVGCTGVVNKVSTWMSTMMQSPTEAISMAQAEIAKYKNLAKQACLITKSATQVAGGSIPFVGGIEKGLSTAIEASNIAGGVSSIGVTRINSTSVDTKTLAVSKGSSPSSSSSQEKACIDNVNAMSDEVVQQQIEANKIAQSNTFKEQCFDGIAVTLARNQLTSMTRSAMNWVNSGLGGNPFFVQNMQSLITKMENNVVETGIDILLDPGTGNPYAQDFSKSLIYTRSLKSSSAGFLGNLASNLEDFVTSPTSYYTDEQLQSASNTNTAIYRAKQANETFARNFSSGGWNAWLALTQKEANNPLGFNMMASQYLADIQANKISDLKTEVTSNNGFLSQKECIKWQIYTYNETIEDYDKAYTSDGKWKYTTSDPGIYAPDPSDTNHVMPYGVCVDWKVITPGSLIKDKISNYLDSPERQLELVKTINDSLNYLFSVLLSKLQTGGLSGLSDSSVNTTNWIDDLNSLSSDSSDTNSGSSYSGFNLTSDLGNTYIHEDTTKVGTWDAAESINLTSTVNPETGLKEKLYVGIAPVLYDGIDSNGKAKTVYAKNIYYEVTNPGKTKLMDDSYNSWEKGDRAFWDGEKWQNWKKGQISPIKKRGVIQIQQDYVVAAQEVLKVLPGVMPALGELDYCLPGPNPNYKINSSNAQSAFGNWINSTYVGPKDSSGERYGVSVDGEGDTTFETLKTTYPNVNIWKSVATEKVGVIKYNNETIDLTMPNIFSVFTNICNSNQPESLSGSTKLSVSLVDVAKYIYNPIWAIGSIIKNSSSSNCKGDYTYAKNGDLSTQQANNLNFKKAIKEYLNSYVNNYMFEKFYDTFDNEMESKYFIKMTDKYIEVENETLDTTKHLNKAYIPMAESGFSFTKNIVTYSENTATEQNEYSSSISQAKINIAKLEPIKAEVSKIIIAAQNRRYKQLVVAEKKSLGITITEDQVTAADIAAIKTKYKKCFDEENISFFDADEIYDSEKRGAEACNDGIDNDLDGKVDSKDSDCATQTTEENQIESAPRERLQMQSEDEV